MPYTPKHCPGFESFKHLKSFSCACPGCGKSVEIFSDEFDRPRACKGCGKEIDFRQCRLEGEGGDPLGEPMR